MVKVSLTVEDVHQAIDECTLQSSTPSQTWRRIIQPEEWALAESISNCNNPPRNNNNNNNNNDNDINDSKKPPFCFGIQSINPLGDNTLKASSSANNQRPMIMCTFYLAYSTWDARMLYIDQVVVGDGFNVRNGDNDDCDCYSSEEVGRLYRILAKIAIKLHCARLTWKEKQIPKWSSPQHPPEFLKEWLFLEMDRTAMTAFLNTSRIDTHSIATTTKASITHDETKRVSLDRSYMEQIINQCLDNADMTTKTQRPNVTVRLAGPNDVDSVSHLVQQLAIYENEPDAVKATAEDYLVDGLNAESNEALFYCLLVDVHLDGATNTSSSSSTTTSTTTTCGMGLFYLGFTLKEGSFMYLEDLFVEESHRGLGCGTVIMERLALIALALDCCKFTWTALDWNTPALNFYKKMGAIVNEDGLKITRYCGDEIRSFAAAS
ncbi:acyl-CoA N-acyltransferase [Nitzschia inconspicua]|uniref:Acyl-CoA N-acyltransferase n=1 Tax=Nitzschia inconspicua TaxID=303405 RepID=A0A9K3LAY6_9STRA|nr:acyl-CoA N-acyltransferase [Nitzschia inconspicua]